MSGAAVFEPQCCSGLPSATVGLGFLLGAICTCGKSPRPQTCSSVQLSISIHLVFQTPSETV
eukprot:5291189-Pyramimonas_sp.AAC.1